MPQRAEYRCQLIKRRMFALQVVSASTTSRSLLDLSTTGPVPCASCSSIVKRLDLLSGNKTDLAKVVAELDGQCKEHFKDTDLLLCDVVVSLAVEKLLPAIIKGLDTVAWDAHATCAALGSCLVPCCLSETKPEQLRLSLTQRPSEMVVSWTTHQNSSSEVQYGPTPGAHHLTAHGSSTVDFGEHAFGWRGRLHRATMTGLTPGVRYYYRVGDAVGGFSDLRSFVALLPDAGTRTPLRIAFIADMGWGDNSNNTIKQLTRLATSTNASERIDLVVHNGDVGYADGNMHGWDLFLRKIEPIASCMKWDLNATPSWRRMGTGSFRV